MQGCHPWPAGLHLLRERSGQGGGHWGQRQAEQSRIMRGSHSTVRLKVNFLTLT